MVPDEVVEDGKTYCEVIMRVMHMGNEKGWSRFPLEDFSKLASNDTEPDTRSGPSGRVIGDP